MMNPRHGHCPLRGLKLPWILGITSTDVLFKVCIAFSGVKRDVPYVGGALRATRARVDGVEVRGPRGAGVPMDVVEDKEASGRGFSSRPLQSFDYQLC